MKSLLIHLVKYLIQIIESYEYKNIELDEDDISKKILNTLDISNCKILTDTGYEDISSIHITQPYKHYIIKTGDYILSGADNHIVFDSNMNEIFIKDLKIGSIIQTISGPQLVESIKFDNWKSSMFDVTVNSLNHRFYSNGILSHNTISSAIFMLHTILFNNDKNIMVVANKGDTAIEIVDKIKSIYTLLPFFLKPGIKTWNQKSLSFDNGCRIKISARTKTPAIGFTIDLLYLDEFAHIPSNIIEPYYTAAFPTTAAVKNSKIIITSTPFGMNLFYRLLTDAERPDGDPQKNNYKAMRVYWYQVPGRFVTYLRLNEHSLYKHDLTKEEIFESVRSMWGDKTKIELEWNQDLQKWVITLFNNPDCIEDDVRKFNLFKDDKQISILSLAEVTTWKEEAIKDIGGEDAFNQEYGLRFINASKSLLNESIIEDILSSKRNYVHEEFFEFDRLKFSYSDLKWIDDSEIFIPIKRKEYKILISVDVSEGLGQDYSVINIFKLGAKPISLIEQQKTKNKSISDYFRLEQIGLYRSNVISIEQLADILYLIAFEFFNPDNVKVVLEINNHGLALLYAMQHVFDGNNNYGSYVFARYKHRIDASEEKIGLKVGDNKSIMVKSYQDLMTSKSYLITNEDTIREISTFVKHITSSGNIRYAADTGHDDTVMTIVNSTSYYDNLYFREMCEELLDKLDKETSNFIRKCMMESNDYIESVDYGQLLNIRRRIIGGRRLN